MIEAAAPKLILDACCGPRYMWFNKDHPNALYIDLRNGEVELSEKYGTVNIRPDKVMDFRKLDFKDCSFKLVVLDPPHLVRCGPKSILGRKFGVLNAETWQSDIRRGFNECWRVLEDYGVLILKWNDHDIKVKRLLEQLPIEPLFGNLTSGSKASQTLWFTFMKIPGKETK